MERDARSLNEAQEDAAAEVVAAKQVAAARERWRLVPALLAHDIVFGGDAVRPRRAVLELAEYRECGVEG